MAKIPNTIRLTDPDGNPIPRGLWVRDRGIVACNRGLVYGLANTPPPCACASESAVGACCINGVCSQLTAAACADAAGTFRGIGQPCLPNTCIAPPCCSGPCVCFVSGSYTVVAYIRLRAHHEYTGGGSPLPDNDSSNSLTENRVGVDGSCSYGGTISVASQNTYAGVGGAIVATAGFLSCPSFPGQPAFVPTIAVSIDLGTTEYIQTPCGGGSFSVLMPDITTGGNVWSNIRVEGFVYAVGAARCDGTPDLGRCCFPNGQCQNLVPLGDCLGLGGDWEYGKTCAQAPCNGACCHRVSPGSGLIVCDEVSSEAQCLGFYQGLSPVWHGTGTTCNAVQCQQPIGCCEDATCSGCFVRGAEGAQDASINVFLSADFYSGSPTCVFVGGGSQSNSNSAPITSNTCDYSIGASASLPPPGGPGPTLTAACEFRSCDASLGLGPHVVIVCAGITTRHNVACNGGFVTATRPGGFGLPCGTGKNWRNITINVTPEITGAYPCTGTLARAPSIPKLSSSGCSGCGGGKETRGGLL